VWARSVTDLDIPRWLSSVVVIDRRPGVGSDEPDGTTVDGLIFLVERQRDLITAVATGTRITPALNEEYRVRRGKVRAALGRLRIGDPYPWPDLDSWWGYCAAPRFTTYRQRRAYVSEVTSPVLDELGRRRSSVTDWHLEGATESWTTVEARLASLKDRFDTALELDDWQDVGRRAREVLIAATNVVFDEGMIGEGEATPQEANAKARFDAVVEALAEGSSHDTLRQLMKAAWELAQKVTHSDGITRVDAFAATQSTIVIVRTLQEIERAIT
jgi:hypothetical protein